MPTYEYECKSCEHKWEVIQKITEPKITVCEKCKKETAKRVISVSSFQLIGSGWAKDNYSK